MTSALLTALLLLAMASAPQARRQVAVTFDDLPSTQSTPARMKYVTARLLRSITANRVPAIGFVNEQKLYVDGTPDPERVNLLRQWLESGLDLGNHSFSHVTIDGVPLESYKQEVIRGEIVTRKLLAARGSKLRYYRHTQLRTGPTLEYKNGLQSFLRERGYTVAPVTIDNNEYIFAAVYSRAKGRGDTATMKRVADAYVLYMDRIFDFFERLSKESLGYEVRQTLLLHANELNADHFDDLVRMMRRRGYTFITLEEALKDPAYRLPEAQSNRGLSWLHRWMLAKGQTMRPEPLEPAFVRELFDRSRS